MPASASTFPGDPDGGQGRRVGRLIERLADRLDDRRDDVVHSGTWGQDPAGPDHVRAAQDRRLDLGPAKIDTGGEFTILAGASFGFSHPLCGSISPGRSLGGS